MIAYYRQIASFNYTLIWVNKDKANVQIFNQPLKRENRPRFFYISDDSLAPSSPNALKMPLIFRTIKDGVQFLLQHAIGDLFLFQWIRGSYISCGHNIRGTQKKDYTVDVKDRIINYLNNICHSKGFHLCILYVIPESF